MSFIPSKYQQAIFDVIPTLTKGQNLIIEARAGSGKTSTIVAGLKLIPNEQVLFLAFNKIIAEDLKKKVPPNVEASTLNSYGWRVCLRNLRVKPRLDAGKTGIILKELTGDKMWRACRYSMSQMVGLLKSQVTAPSNVRITARDILDKFGIELPEKITWPEYLDLLDMLYRECVNCQTLMDFDDQIFMPVYYRMNLGRYTKVFIDEAQDLSPVQHDFVAQLADSVIAVGDPRQAIYGFRGADPESMANFQRQLDAKVLPLSICYRCPIAVIKLAQNIVPDIEWAPDAKEGIVKTIKRVEMNKMWQDGDYVLCRVTAPLVVGCLAMIRERRPAVIKGRDIGKNLSDLAEKIERDFPFESFRESVQGYRMDQDKILTRMEREAELIVMNDKCDTLLAIWESLVNDKLDDIKAKHVAYRIGELFSDDCTRGTIFSTIHRVKGIEAERVFIISMDLLPHPRAKKGWQQVQEKNLYYVAITRAQEELYLEEIVK